MRYTKAALLLFGGGLLFGFVVVVGEFAALQRPAAAVMALGLALVPLGLFADGHGMALLRRVLGLLSRRKRRKRQARKPARKSSGRRASRSRTAARKPRRQRS